MARKAPKAEKKKTGKQSAPKAGGAGRLSTAAGQLLTKMLADAGDRGHAASVATLEPVALADATAVKPVVFNCSNANCLVGITAGTLNITFAGTGGATMPVGSFPIFWRVQGGGVFKLTVQSGGTLSSPIDSTAPDAGTRTLTVS